MAIGIECQKDEEGCLIISEYRKPNAEFSFYDLGINENKLIKNVKEIKGKGDFSHSELTNLGNLQFIGGRASFEGSKITNLKNLQSIGGCAYFSNSQITDLGDLQTIGGMADFRYSEITDLGELKLRGEKAKAVVDYTVSTNLIAQLKKQNCEIISL